MHYVWIYKKIYIQYMILYQDLLCLYHVNTYHNVYNIHIIINIHTVYTLLIDLSVIYTVHLSVPFVWVERLWCEKPRNCFQVRSISSTDDVNLVLQKDRVGLKTNEPEAVGNLKHLQSNREDRKQKWHCFLLDIITWRKKQTRQDALKH